MKLLQPMIRAMASDFLDAVPHDPVAMELLGTSARRAVDGGGGVAMRGVPGGAPRSVDAVSPVWRTAPVAPRMTAGPRRKPGSAPSGSCVHAACASWKGVLGGGDG